MQANVRALHKSPERNLIAKKLLLSHSSILYLTSMLLFSKFTSLCFVFLTLCLLFFVLCLCILHYVISHPFPIFLLLFTFSYTVFISKFYFITNSVFISIYVCISLSSLTFFISVHLSIYLSFSKTNLFQLFVLFPFSLCLNLSSFYLWLFNFFLSYQPFLAPFISLFLFSFLSMTLCISIYLSFFFFFTKPFHFKLFFLFFCSHKNLTVSTLHFDYLLQLLPAFPFSFSLLFSFSLTTSFYLFFLSFSISTSSMRQRPLTKKH